MKGLREKLRGRNFQVKGKEIKVKKRMLLLTVAALVICCSGLLAQNVEKGDTLWVNPLDSEGNFYLGALNEAIHTDTTETGENAHAVYELQPNAQYILTETIQVNSPIEIYAPEPTDEKRPPVIRNGTLDDGENVPEWFAIYADLKVTNCWLSLINLDGNGPTSWIVQYANASGIEIEYDGCILEAPYTWWAMFADYAGNNVYKINDCIFQYVGNPTGTTWNGAIFNHNIMDSLVVRNSTFFDFGCFALNGGNGTFYMEADHCTFVNSVVHPLGNGNIVKQVFTNNLFVNCHAYSDDVEEITRHYDVQVKGLINLSEVQWNAQELDSLWGPSGAYGFSYDPDGSGVLEIDEVVAKLENNVYWYTEPITSYWDSYSEVVANPFMNDWTQAMFDNKSGDWTWDLKVYTWADSAGNIIESPESYDTLMIVDSTVITQNHPEFQYYTESNTMNVDPGIIDMNDCDASLAQNCINIRKNTAGEEVTPVSWHNVDNYLAFTWPLDYDLSYTNEALKTAGRNGKPIGALHWWDMEYEPTAIDNKTKVAESFKLNQNYPNPFNPTTTIAFQIGKPSQVKLTVYDIMGREIKTLVNNNKNAGTYDIVWDATNNNGAQVATGVYFYQLQAGDKTFVKKMLLMK